MSDWLRSWSESISSDINEITNVEILNTDIDEWANYLSTSVLICIILTQRGYLFIRPIIKILSACNNASPHSIEMDLVLSPKS